MSTEEAQPEAGEELITRSGGDMPKTRPAGSGPDRSRVALQVMVSHWAHLDQRAFAPGAASYSATGNGTS
jgi:hypothetical protein